MDIELRNSNWKLEDHYVHEPNSFERRVANTLTRDDSICTSCAPCTCYASLPSTQR